MRHAAGKAVDSFVKPSMMVALVVGLLLAAPACGGGDDDGDAFTFPPITDPTSGTGGVDPLPTSPMTEPERRQRVLNDANQVEGLLDAFWQDELATDDQITFDPPDDLEYYEGSVGNRPCGTDTGSKQNNAYYCFVDASEFVAFDLNWFQQYLIEHPGDATTFLILAHEWGHAVQDAWLEAGGNDSWSPPYRKELNADCLAGVFLSAEIASGQITEEPGDADAVFGWLYEVGGPWFDPGDHGTKEQRIAAFSDGYENDANYCRSTY
jgi:uncharacterized protein